PEDAHLLMAPAAIEDEDLWLQWFSDTLSKCEEARKANRDCRTNGPIARIGWADTNPYSVIDNSDPLETPSNNESDGEHDDIPPYHVASAHGPTPTFKTRNSPEGSHLPPPPFSWDDLPTEYPDLESSPIQEAMQKIRCQHNYHRRCAKLDPRYNDDLFTDCPGGRRFLARIQPVCPTRPLNGPDPFIKAYINGTKATTLIDTGATSSFISATFWHHLGQPPLGKPKSSFVSADSSNLEMLGRGTFKVRLAGRTVDFPFWVMSTALTDCIVGIDLLRYLGAVINLRDKTLTLDDGDHLLTLDPLPESSKTQHHFGQATQLPRSTTILLEPSKHAPVHVAAALYKTQHTIFVEVINPSESPLVLDSATPIGTWTALPQVFEERTTSTSDSNMSDNTSSTQSLSTPVSTDAGSGSVLTQFGAPGAVCPIQTTARPIKELPIDWTDSSLSVEQRELLRKTLLEFSDIFVDTSKAPGRTHLVEFSIDTGDSPNSISSIQDLEGRRRYHGGRDQPIPGPWSHQAIQKSMGQPNYRRLNKVTVKDSYPMPRIDDLLDVLAGPSYSLQWTSRRDTGTSRWQKTALKRPLSHASTDSTSGSLCHLVYAVPCFERLLEQILMDYMWRTCLVYLDDCIVFSEDFGSHLVRLRQVLSKFRDAGFKLKMSKCKWGRSSVPFLGHIVTPAGILPNPEKIKSVLRIKPLKDVAEVRAFLGLAGYFRRFVKDFAEIAAPLTALLSTDTFTWTPECDQALDTLKRRLVAPPVLAHPDFDLPFSIWVDASHIAVGAVLMQKQHGRNRVIAYASQSLSKAQAKWINKDSGISEIECYGVVWATRKFRPYIDKRHFTIYTDHQALTWLFNTGTRSGNHKLARWAMELQGLDYTVVHKPGDLNGAADGLSRLACPIQIRSRTRNARTSTVDHETHTHDIESQVVQPRAHTRARPLSLHSTNIKSDHARSARFNTPDPPSKGSTLNSTAELFDVRGRPTARLYNEQGSDPEIAAIRAYLEDGAVPLDPRLNKRVTRNGHQFTVRQGIVCRYVTIETPLRTAELVVVPMVPRSMIEEVLWTSHCSPLAGHLGFNKTRERIRLTAYWTDWIQDCKDFVTMCPDCNKAKGGRPTKQGPIQRMPVYDLKGPFDLMVLDALGPLPTTENGNKYILVFGDYFTRWIEAFP
ncbi:hypothetical protein LEN26_013195, partial [Aphanomyces euteiches]